MSTRWILLFLTLPFITQALPSKVKFFQGNLSSAKEVAGQEGKLYFAEFSASWCAPCRILEETTFSDPSVVDYISKNYIPVKVDIDDFDGIALKQVYNVQTIPTIIIFNSKGKLLEKYDQSLPTSKMLQLLKKHNIPANRVKTVSTAMTSPQGGAQNSYYDASPRIKPSANKPKLRESHSPMRTTGTPGTPSRPDKNPATPARVEENLAIAPVGQSIPEGDGLYRFTVNLQASQGFSVQIGAFREYGNVLREVARVQKMFEQPILVHIVKKGDQSTYKILVGAFTTRQQAIDYQSQIKRQGVAGVIKDLSLMK